MRRGPHLIAGLGGCCPWSSATGQDFTPLLVWEVQPHPPAASTLSLLPPLSLSSLRRPLLCGQYHLLEPSGASLIIFVAWVASSDMIEDPSILLKEGRRGFLVLESARKDNQMHT